MDCTLGDIESMLIFFSDSGIIKIKEFLKKIQAKD